MKRQHGVTLIELLIAMAIIGIIGAIAIPAYRNYVTAGQQGAIVERVNGLRVYVENARIDAASGAYQPGTYISGGTNDFLGIGYQVPGDTNGIKMVVAAGACGTLATCYKITATDNKGKIGVYDSGTGTFAWP